MFLLSIIRVRPSPTIFASTQPNYLYIDRISCKITKKERRERSLPCYDSHGLIQHVKRIYNNNNNNNNNISYSQSSSQFNSQTYKHSTKPKNKISVGKSIVAKLNTKLPLNEYKTGTIWSTYTSKSLYPSRKTIQSACNSALPALAPTLSALRPKEELDTTIYIGAKISTKPNFKKFVNDYKAGKIRMYLPYVYFLNLI